MISVKRAHHIGAYLIDIEFSDGASGFVDLRDTVSKYEAAAKIRDPAEAVVYPAYQIFQVRSVSMVYAARRENRRSLRFAKWHLTSMARYPFKTRRI